MNHRPCKYATLLPLNSDTVRRLLDDYSLWSYLSFYRGQGTLEITVCRHPDQYEPDFFLSADLTVVTLRGIQCTICPIPTERQCPFYTAPSCVNSFEPRKDPKDA